MCATLAGDPGWRNLDEGGDYGPRTCVFARAKVSSGQEKPEAMIKWTPFFKSYFLCSNIYFKSRVIHG